MTVVFLTFLMLAQGGGGRYAALAADLAPRCRVPSVIHHWGTTRMLATGQPSWIQLEVGERPRLRVIGLQPMIVLLPGMSGACFSHTASCSEHALHRFAPCSSRGAVLFAGASLRLRVSVSGWYRQQPCQPHMGQQRGHLSAPSAVHPTLPGGWQRSPDWVAQPPPHHYSIERLRLERDQSPQTERRAHDLGAIHHP